jgi:hypothetical protein|tara:strand:- start:303 stop:626 length:324 start_codon:yes stop_codon:yes gene_type:complete
MLDEVRPNEPTDEPDWSMTKGKHFLNKWISPHNKVYQIDEVIFVDDYGNQLPTNDPVSIDLVVQMYVSGMNHEESIYQELCVRGQELFCENTNWEFEVNETELVCLV